jgi:outer membrane protein assembly factor BamB
MGKPSIREIFLIGVMILICAHLTVAQDWPQWRGPNRDGKVTGFTAPAEWPQQLTQVWTTTVGLGDATPALVGQKLYVFTRQGEDEVTLCLDAGNGKQLWKEQYQAQAVTGAAARHPGPRSSPAVAGGRVITLGVGGIVSCLDADSGKVVWRKDPFPKVVPLFFTGMSPIIVDGMVIAHLGGQGNGALIAYDLVSGDERWRWGDESPEYASPALLNVSDTKQLVTLAEKSIVGIGASDGKLLWQLPFAPQRRAYNAATPIIDGHKVIYTGAGRGAKAVKIEKQGDGFAAQELWSNAELAPQFNTPVLKNGLLFGLSDKGTLYCLNAENGQTAWVDETRRDRGGFAAIVDAGSVLFALPSSSELIVLEPTDKAFTQLAAYKASETPSYAHPIIAGRRIFIKDQETVTLWMLD